MLDSPTAVHPVGDEQETAKSSASWRGSGIGTEDHDELTAVLAVDVLSADAVVDALSEEDAPAAAPPVMPAPAQATAATMTTALRDHTRIRISDLPPEETA